MELYGSNGPELCFADGIVLPVSDSLGQHLLCFKLTGCTKPRCHYRWCTSKTVQLPSDLWCPFCMYCEQLWQQASKRLLTAGELAFMGLITALGVDTNFTCQVVPPFWHAPMDFYNMQHGYYVQVDGRCHWVGMHDVSNIAITERDMQQNLAAVGAGVHLVRVHERDISNKECVAAALEAAGQGYSIVLTPTYTAAWVCSGQQLLPYTQALLLLAPNCRCDTDLYGNSRLHTM